MTQRACDTTIRRSRYPVAAILGTGVREEHVLRMAPWFTGALASLAAAALAFALARSATPPVRLMMSATAGLLAATSPYHVLASSEIGPHAAFALFSCLSLLGLTLTLQGAGRRWWAFSCAATGLAALTVPYWILLLPPLLWTWWVQRWKKHKAATAASGAIAAGLAVALAWPPFVYDAAFVKPILMYGGILLNPLQSVQPPGAWLLDLLRTHPLACALGVVGLPVLVNPRGAVFKTLAPTLIFMVGFMVLNLRVGHMKPLYASDVVLPAVALACASAGLMLVQSLRRWAFLAAALVLILGVLSIEQPSPMTSDDADWRGVIASLEQQFSGKRILVTPRPAGGILKYYLRRTEVVLDSNREDDRVSVKGALSAGAIDAIVQWGASFEPAGVASEVTAHRQRDGSVSVQGTVVSWWRHDP